MFVFVRNSCRSVGALAILKHSCIRAARIDATGPLRSRRASGPHGPDLASGQVGGARRRAWWPQRSGRSGGARRYKTGGKSYTIITSPPRDNCRGPPITSNRYHKQHTEIQRDIVSFIRGCTPPNLKPTGRAALSTRASRNDGRGLRGRLLGTSSGAERLPGGSSGARRRRWSLGRVHSRRAHGGRGHRLRGLRQKWPVRAQVASVPPQDSTTSRPDEVDAPLADAHDHPDAVPSAGGRVLEIDATADLELRQLAGACIVVPDCLLLSLGSLLVADGCCSLPLRSEGAMVRGDARAQRMAE